jgi:putative pyoverdin transport system ATP-binding/permease protein
VSGPRHKLPAKGVWGNIVKIALFLFRISGGLLVTAIVTSIVAGVSSAGMLALINIALRGSSLTEGSLAWPYVGLGLVVLASFVYSQVLLIKLAQEAMFDLRMKLCKRILAAPLRRLEEVGTPRLLATLTDDVQVISGAMLNLPRFFVVLTTLLVCMAYLMWLSWKVLLVMLGFILVGIVIYQLLVSRAIRSFKIVRELQDSLLKHFRGVTDGIKELKLNTLRREEFLAEQLEPTSRSFLKHNVHAMTLYTASSGWGQLLFYIFIGLLLFVVPKLSPISTDTLIVYTLTAFFIWGLLGTLLGTFPTFGRADVALNKIESLGLSLSPAKQQASPEAIGEIKPGWRRIELAGVTHSYFTDSEDKGFTLGPIDLSFCPAEIVVLYGGNGSGKTTLAKLLTGLYEPISGEVLVDGQRVTDQNREAYRQRFSAVFSDYYLFDSLLGIGKQALDSRAQEYLNQFHLSHKVEVKEGTLSTTALSSGQRKRLALLTAYLEDRTFYVFDEWAADQDPVFKDIFYTQLLPELKARGKTVLVVTHDDRYFRIADRLVKLEYGKLTQEPLATVMRS